MKYCPKCQRNYAVTQSVCQDDGEPLSLKDLYGLSGRVINNKYRIDSLVTIGGMSAVYRARQIGVERRVAVKILLPNLAIHDLNLLSLFEREARTAGRLTHENIATVHDAGRTEDDLAFIVMEWLEGKTLEEEFYEKGALSYRRILHLSRQIAAALDAAHAQNVIHRDLKPANIMIIPRPTRSVRQEREEERDLVKVFDFGLAKISSESTDLQVSSALGTPHYASPEQFRIGEEIDGRSDIYSFGVILYRMLTGRLPFDGHSIHELIRQHLLETPPPLRHLRPDAPLELEHLVNRMLTKTPHYRPATATEAVEAFEQALQGRAASGDRATTYDPAQSGQQTPVTPISLPAIGLSAGPGSGQYTPVTVPSVSQSGPPSAAPIAGAAAGLPTPTAAPARTNTYVSFQTNTTPLSAPTNSGNVAPAPFATTTAHPASLGAALIPDAPPASVPATPAFKHFKMLALVTAAVLLIGFALFYLFGNSRTSATEPDTLLLGDVLNTTGEEGFDRSLKTVLASQLTQTATLRLLPEEKMRAMLPYMNRPPDEPVTRELAREIAWRSSLKAAITTQIAKLDRHYSITLEALNSQSGETIARVMAEAPSQAQVITALNQAAQKLRTDLGTLLPALPPSTLPVHEGTTASLEALKAYSQGLEQLYALGNPTEALPYLQRASSLDPNFALPHAMLSAAYLNTGLARQSTAAASQAYQLRAHASERERQIIEARYHMAVTGDLNKAIEIYQGLARTAGDKAFVHTGLAKLYWRQGQLAQTLTEAEAALKLAPHALLAHWLRANALIRLNRIPEAKEHLARALAQKMDGPALRHALFQVAYWQSDGEALKQQLDWTRAQHQDERGLDWQAQLAAANGSLQTASAYWQQAVALAQQRNPKEAAANLALTAALRLGLAGQTSEAQKFLSQALTLSRDNVTLFPLTTDAPFGPLVCALVGTPEEAQRTANELLKNQPDNVLAKELWLPLTRAVLAWRNHDPAQALALLNAPALNEMDAGLLPHWVRGHALLQLKRGPEAQAEFQQILSRRGQDSTWLLYPLSYLGMARALALKGEIVPSRRYYKDFLELWRGADAGLPALTAAKQEYLALDTESRPQEVANR